jgi:signal transduction histidine kinase/ActR/RegA family two-component response regulator
MNFRHLAPAVGIRPLWFQLALLSAVIVLPLLLTSYVMFDRMVENSRTSTKQSLLLNAKTLASLVDNEIQTHVAIASTLAYSPALQTGNLAEFWQETTNALKFVPGSTLDLADSEGNILITTMQPVGMPIQMKLPTAWVKATFATTGSHVGNLAEHGISKKPMITVTTPVIMNDQNKFILSLNIPPDRFQKLLANKFNAGEVVGILDTDQKFVARIPDIQHRLGTLASEGWRAAIAASPEGWTENRVLEGDWSMTGYAPTSRGWIVGVAQLESAFEGPFQNILLSTLAATFLLSGFGLLVAIAIARHASRGMAAIAQSARDLGNGKPVVELPAPFREAQIISHNLAVASAELERRRAALNNANTELELKVAERTQSLQEEMKRREETETTLRQVQKIETIGQLTGGIAHDFNNMLTIVMGNLDTVQRRMAKLKDATELKQPVANALKGAKSAADMTQRLLAFSRQQALQPKPISINALVSDVSNLLTRTVGENTKLETVLAAGLWQTFADANQLENALINLVVNARDAMPEGGKLSIETANVLLDDYYVSRFGDLKAGQYVMLSVTDEGSGIPPDKLEKVFEPFFTTKGPGKGTGLGLAMIHGFVKQSGGHIRIYSEVGHGTTVKLYLPRLLTEETCLAHPEDNASVRKTMPRAKKGETILLVEDEAGVRDYAVSVLKELGYYVLSAADGKQALATYKNSSRVDLLFTDVVLGGTLNGRELADNIRNINSAMPVLFTTGYTRNAIFHHGRLDPGVNLLNKPYTQQDLAAKIRDAIDQQ